MRNQWRRFEWSPDIERSNHADTQSHGEFFANVEHAHPSYGLG